MTLPAVKDSLQWRTLITEKPLCVCMARRPRAMHEQQHTSWHVSLLVFFCMLLEQEPWGMLNDCFLYGNSTGEKGTSPSFSSDFFPYWFAPLKFGLLSTWWVKENKSVPQLPPCMHGQDFLGLQKPVLFPVLSLERQQRIWVVVREIFGEQSHVWLTFLFCTAASSWNNWHN